jgi:nucleoside-diphosphate-sugar epimerase
LKYVFHFASPASPPHYQRLGLETMWVNSVGLSLAMTFADQVGARVIFSSTSEIYGDPEISPQPETYWGNVNTLGPRSCYDESKRFGESLIYTYNLKNKTQHGLVRIFNTYGPRMNPNDGRVIINFLVQAMKGEALTVYGSGQQTRSFCYVDDLIEGIMKYAESPLTEPVNIGNDHEFTILEAAETVKKIFSDKKLKIEFQALPKDDPKQRKPDLSKAKKLLAPWSPKVSLAEGLRHVIKWLEQT